MPGVTVKEKFGIWRFIIPALFFRNCFSLSKSESLFAGSELFPTAQSGLNHTSGPGKGGDKVTPSPA